jgi:hypothetical protein
MTPASCPPVKTYPAPHICSELINLVETSIDNTLAKVLMAAYP